MWCKPHQASQKPPKEHQHGSAVGTGKAGFPPAKPGQDGQMQTHPKAGSLPKPPQSHRQTWMGVFG